VPADHVVKRVVQSVPLPQVTPRQRSGGYGPGSPGGPVVPGFGNGSFGPPNGQPQGPPVPYGQQPFGQPQGQPGPFGPPPNGAYGQPPGPAGTGATAASLGDRPDGPQPV
jgi:MoxR-like ATPase